MRLIKGGKDDPPEGKPKTIPGSSPGTKDQRQTKDEYHDPFDLYDPDDDKNLPPLPIGGKRRYEYQDIYDIVIQHKESRAYILIRNSDDGVDEEIDEEIDDELEVNPEVTSSQLNMVVNLPKALIGKPLTPEQFKKFKAILNDESRWAELIKELE
jgi:hypothetical protein